MIPASPPAIDRRPLRLLLVAPEPGSGGVGDYAADLAAALGVAGVDVHCVHTPGPGRDSTLDAIRAGSRLRRLLVRGGPEARTVVHLELSAGSVAPLWATARVPSTVAVTATLHDPPHAAWWPVRTRAVARSRLLTHGIHYPLRHAWWRLEQRLLRRAAFFTLSSSGARTLAPLGRPVSVLPHYVPVRAVLPAPERRPLAVGLFGYLYGGKGFEQLGELRRLIPAEVDVHVAGRGTERLPALPGVRVWGGVEGDREREFFASVRCLVLPYEAGGRYGPMLSASGAAARAYAYGTPVVAPAVRAFEEEARRGALWAVEPGTPRLAARAAEVARTPSLLGAAASAANGLRRERSAIAVARRMVATWSAL